ncbi:MAG: dienelactone hydrolase family protein [Pseudomonadota bacterium]|jgi:dienelactone hydrolase|nr:dienelactone hydrolase family protein [Pseudomonadota bacterium]MEC8102176.1 dienelactone hydrolase family protein [Pseudomonadota bacterium]MEC8523092.1 dienelactone hydrolase family protein [Pseudomonadota bacterium]MEE2749605.1 dienelactone hydrolase family protein [Pseudomonadota bacterium]
MKRLILSLASFAALSTTMTTHADVCQHDIQPAEHYSEAAYFYPCQGEYPHPAVTLTGGYSNTYHKLQWMAEAMAEAGYVVLAMTPINKYGKVEQWRDAHLAGQATLVETATKEGSPLAGRIDTKHRAITGFSMGGGGTLLAGSMLGDEVSALVAFAPFLLAEQRDVSPTAPTMILAGAKDLLVTNESIAEIYQHVEESAEQRFLAVYSDGRHQQWYRPEITKNRESYIELTLAWLDYHLNERSSALQTLTEAGRESPETFERLDKKL